MAPVGDWLPSYPLKRSILLLSCLAVVAAADPLHGLITTMRAIARTSGLSIDAIYQFGDSVSDTGNLIREYQSDDCITFPYGESYFHFATGRCCDGLIMADYYATAFGLQFLNPYLDKGANFNNGVNFAVVGATALDVSFLESMHLNVTTTNSSLSVQLGWFREHLKSICSSLPECSSKLGRSIVLMEAIGGNDYSYIFRDDRSFQFAYELVPDVVQAIMDVVKEIILMGAVNVVVPAQFPLGCLPYYLTKLNSTAPDKYDDLGCLADLNKLMVYHNEELQKGIQELQMLYPNATLIYADYYTAIMSLLRNSSSLGFEQSANLKTCCGFGKNPYNFDASDMCGRLGVPVCPRPEKRVMWDGFHLTQRSYMYLSNWMLNGTIIPGLSRSSSI